jgi:hypothetical protein
MISETISNFFDIDELDVDFINVSSDITSVDRVWGEDVIFRYYRKRGFPHYTILDFEKISHFNQLCKFDEVTIFKDGEIDQTMHGLRLAWSYFPHHWAVACSGSKSPLDAFNDDDTLRKVIRKTWDWVLKHQDDPKFHENRLRQNLKVYGASQSVSNFRPTAAKWIYNNYGNGGVIWDMSMGWGGRLLGFLSSNCHTYIGTEPSTDTFNALVRLDNDFKWVGKNTELYKMGSEEFKPQPNSLDLCFTSPPYFDTEKYSDEDTQSFKKFPTPNDWANGFLRQTFQNCWDGLKSDRYMLINIANTPKNKWIESETIRVAQDIGFIHQTTLYLVLSSISGAGKKLEPIFVFMKDKI